MTDRSIADFPPASLQTQLDELLRERKMRERVYPLFVAKGQLTQRQADYRMNALQGAIDTLKRLIAAAAGKAP